MRIRVRGMSAVLGTVLASGLVLAGAGSASAAAIPRCPAGAACVWTGYSYEDPRLTGVAGTRPGGYFYNYLDLTKYPNLNNRVVSVANNGRNNVACFYDKIPTSSSESFCLNNPARGGTTRDPDLTDGVGSDRRNWANKISYAHFVY